MKTRLIPILLACALPFGVATAAAAQRPPASAAAARPQSLEQAVKQVQQRTGGHILAADTVSRGRSNVYRIKVLTPQGQVRVVQMHSNERPQQRGRKSDSDQGGH